MRIQKMVLCFNLSGRLKGERRQSGRVRVVALLAILVGGLCLAVAEEDNIVLVGAGSSVPLPLFKKWSELYNESNKNVQFQYMAMGNAEGINQITKGTSDFGAGEIPLSADERRAGNLMEVPLVLIAIVPIYNLPGVRQELRLSGEVLAEIYMGRIKTWNDPAIAKINPGVSLPSDAIKVVYRPGGKGSNYVFTDFLSKTNARFREQIGRGPSPKWPVGDHAERSSDMADMVKKTPFSLGYVELQYADDNNITHASVQNAAGKFVKGTAESISAACSAVEAPGWDKLSASLTNAPGPTSYPIVSFSWMYTRPNIGSPQRTAALVRFLNWAYSAGQAVAAKEGYSELPKPFVEKVLAKVNSLK